MTNEPIENEVLQKREGKDLENFRIAYARSREFRMKVLGDRFSKKLKMKL